MISADTRYRSISEAQKAIADGEVTVKGLVQEYLSAMKQLDPQLNAITVTNKDALKDAEALDV
jgi:Asp-tRNA(Asn)/Glu-tRNA(Gln) amidotransferase A subunit family amidase